MTSPAPAWMDLREYEAAKFELADIVRAVGTVGGAARRSGGAVSQAARELLARLAEDRFNLAVAGRFSRGKTTLMNAVLGTARLPTGVLPLTSVITSVEYGSRERVQIELEGAAIGFEVAMEALPDYVTERGNPANVRRVRAARVALPAEILRRGFYFIDTPGLGSTVVENTRTTDAFLPQADAVILVSGYDGPLTDDELRVARQAAAAGKPLFVVLNKCDMASPEARREVEDFVRSRLATIVPDESVRVFPLSALTGLEARTAGDRSGYAESGVAALEAELTRFMVEEKNRVLLLGVARRVAALIGHAGGERLDALIERLSAPLAERSRGLGYRERSESEHVGGPPARSGRLASPASDAAPRMEDCVICVQVSKALLDFLLRYQLDLATSAEERRRLAAAGGLCAEHLELYASIAADRETCLTLVPLVLRTADTIRGAAAAGSCVACDKRDEAETAAIAALLERPLGPSSALELGQLPSLCVPHLRAVALRSSNEPLVRALIERQSEAARRLAEDMQRYVMKRDGLRRGLATEEEGQAARRAVMFLAGKRPMASRR